MFSLVVRLTFRCLLPMVGFPVEVLSFSSFTTNPFRPTRLCPARRLGVYSFLFNSLFIWDFKKFGEGKPQPLSPAYGIWELTSKRVSIFHKVKPVNTNLLFSHAFPRAGSHLEILFFGGSVLLVRAAEPRPLHKPEPATCYHTQSRIPDITVWRRYKPSAILWPQYNSW